MHDTTWKETMKTTSLISKVTPIYAANEAVILNKPTVQVIKDLRALVFVLWEENNELRANVATN